MAMSSGVRVQAVNPAATLLDGTPEFFAGGAPVTVYLPTGTATYRGALRNAE